MLDFKSNRLTYAELLAPPADGFELVRAVGTTYSLDLYALLAIPVAMFYSKSLDGDFVQNRYDVLEAIRKSKERVTLFCQRGKIHVPDSYRSLLAFVEDCIVEVLPENEFSSFHPKIWVLRFEKKKKFRYRLAVLSRNLTFDRSWDIACFCDGGWQERPTADGLKLVNYLKHFYQVTGQEPDKKFLKELAYMQFEVPAAFQSLCLFPIIGHTRRAEFPNPVSQQSYEELLVISPFVDDRTVREFREKNQHVTLLSRKDELDKMDQDLLDGLEVYYFNQDIRDGELVLDTEGQLHQYQDLHAKIYLGRNRQVTDWYIGSANSTVPALDRNTEFMIRFSGQSRNAALDIVKKALLSEQNKVFLPYSRSFSPVDAGEETLRHLLRQINYRLSAAVFTGSVAERPEQLTYNLHIRVDLSTLQPRAEVTLGISLIHKPDIKQPLLAGEWNELEFSNIALTHLSRFLAIEVLMGGASACRLVVKAELENMPAQREDVIFNELISSKHAFYQYLQFLLAPDDFDGLLDITGDATSLAGKAGQAQTAIAFNPPIYEQLMLAASRSRAKLKEINQVMLRLEQLNSEVIADFKPVWEIFKKFADD